jgi:Cu/Ag efflux protein CusF
VPEPVPLTEGVIRKLDRASGTVTIKPGEIANLNMGAMTMSFKAKTPAMLKPFKEGDKIRFRAAEVKGELTVTSIEAAK